jgi:hypothetical protein
LLELPWLIAVGIGLCLNNCLAVLEAIVGLRSGFVRTAKHAIEKGPDGWRDANFRATVPGRRVLLSWAELAMGVYLTSALAIAAWHGMLTTAMFIALFAAGFLHVGLLSLIPRNRGALVASSCAVELR